MACEVGSSPSGRLCSLVRGFSAILQEGARHFNSAHCSRDVGVGVIEHGLNLAGFSSLFTDGEAGPGREFADSPPGTCR